MSEIRKDSPERNPGDIYVEGLRQIMETRKVSLEEAAKIAREDIIATKGDEHLEPLAQAVRYIKSLENK